MNLDGSSIQALQMASYDVRLRKDLQAAGAVGGGDEVGEVLLEQVVTVVVALPR